jgi:succinate dehydrogenase / fumarate reductase cytochrome b subunit
VKPRGSKDNRPVNLELTTIKFPITALASISHRVTGVLLFISSVLLVWALDASLASEESFNQLVKLLSSTGAKAALWGFLVIFSYHALAGIRHLIMDAGIGEDFKGGALGARILFVASGLAAVAWGIVLW